MSFQVLLSFLVLLFLYPTLGTQVYVDQRYYWVAVFSHGTLGKGNASFSKSDHRHMFCLSDVLLVLGCPVCMCFNITSVLLGYLFFKPSGWEIHRSGAFIGPIRCHLWVKSLGNDNLYVHQCIHRSYVLAVEIMNVHNASGGELMRLSSQYSKIFSVMYAIYQERFRSWVRGYEKNCGSGMVYFRVTFIISDESLLFHASKR